MARNQVYRGNPELKQSVIFDNFSGGINTTDIDDQMLTNEFRLLRNVELLEKGRIQNRKGFANLVVFNEWLIDQSITLPNNNYYLFYPMLDEYSTFDKMKEYTSFADFKESYVTMPIDMLFFIVVRDELSIKFYTLRFTHAKESVVYTAVFTLEKTIGVVDSTKFVDLKLTGINVESYDGKYYILLNNIHSGKEGIVEFYQKDGDVTINIYDKENSYIPNPYEISNIGFNLLSVNPTTYIRSDTTGVDEIRSIFLTAYDNDDLVLTKIPRTGSFVLNVIYKGSVELAKSLRVRCYVEDEFGEKKYLDLNTSLFSVNEDSGLLRYRMRLRTAGHENIFIEVDKPAVNTDLPYVREFDSLQAAVDFYKTSGTDKVVVDRTATGYATYYVAKNDGDAYGYETETLFDDSTTAGAVSGDSIKMPYIVEHSQSGDLEWYTTYPSLAETYQFALVKQAFYTPAKYVVKLLYINSDGEPTTNIVYSTYKTLNASFTSDVLSYSPQQYQNIRVRLVSEQEESSYVETTSGPTADVTLTNTFTSTQAAKNYILANYNSLENDGKVYRVNVYMEGATGTCWINGVGDLSYTTEAECIADGGTWYVSGDYLFLQFNYVDTTSIYVNYDFYVWNGGQEGNVSDFDLAEVETIVQLLVFTNSYPVGDSNDKPIKSLDLSKAKHIIIKDRMFVYSGNTIIVSDTYSEQDSKSFSYFPNYNYIILSLEANDTIQKIAYFRGSYLIFTKKKIYRMSGTFMSDDFIILTINDALGCVAPDSIRSINNTLIFASEDGLYTVKQNFYQEGLENLDKIDRQIKGIVPRGTKHESIIYNEQYMLFVKDEENNYEKTVKQYYNMQYATKTFPYVVDEYVSVPDLLFKISTDLIAIKSGELWTYDIGYTDFAPVDATEAELEDYTYKWTVLTPYWTLGYPLHEKKFKNFFIKLDSNVVTPVYFTIYVDKWAFSTSFEYLTKLNEYGEIEYYKIVNPVDLATISDSQSEIVVENTPTQETLDPDLVLGDFELGIDALNYSKYQVHKILMGGSAKGKSIALQIEQKKNSYFGLDSIGIIYKLGKMRENR